MKIEFENSIRKINFFVLSNRHQNYLDKQIHEWIPRNFKQNNIILYNKV